MVSCHIKMAVLEGVGDDVAVCVSNRLLDRSGQSELPHGVGRREGSAEVGGDLLHSRIFLTIDSDDESSCVEGRRCRAGLCERCRGFGKDANFVHC